MSEKAMCQARPNTKTLTTTYRTIIEAPSGLTGDRGLCHALVIIPATTAVVMMMAIIAVS